jgi:hypothetical protein
VGTADERLSQLRYQMHCFRLGRALDGEEQRPQNGGEGLESVRDVPSRLPLKSEVGLSRSDRLPSG